MMNDMLRGFMEGQQMGQGGVQGGPRMMAPGPGQEQPGQGWQTSPHPGHYPGMPMPQGFGSMDAYGGSVNDPYRKY